LNQSSGYETGIPSVVLVQVVGCYFDVIHIQSFHYSNLWTEFNGTGWTSAVLANVFYLMLQLDRRTAFGWLVKLRGMATLLRNTT
jgi:hypothetical protein